MLSSHLSPGPPSDVFLSGFPTKMLYALHILPMRAIKASILQYLGYLLRHTSFKLLMLLTVYVWEQYSINFLSNLNNNRRYHNNSSAVKFRFWKLKDVTSLIFPTIYYRGAVWWWGLQMSNRSLYALNRTLFLVTTSEKSRKKTRRR